MSDFKYISGDLSLDFINTVDWTRDGLVNERLTGYDQLADWALHAGLTLRATNERAALRDALRLRSLLRRVFTARDDSALAALNRLLRDASRQRHLVPSKRRVRWAWRDDAFLAPVVWAAANLLASDDARNIRVCGGPACGWLFVDRSRNHLRRWCEMQTCGTVVKNVRRTRSVKIRRKPRRASRANLL